MADVPLSYSAEELVARLEDAVRGSAPAQRWFAALVESEPALARDAAPHGDVMALVATAASSSPDLVRPQLVGRTSRVAEANGAAVARAADVAAALAELVRENAPAEPEPAAPETPSTPVTPVTRATEATDAVAGTAAGPSRTFRVFVSSTFEDFAVERNVLRTEVWPELRELCRQHHARFQAIDLRWGVSEQAALDQQTMNICLGEIQRCQQVTPRPDFLVLLGNRYGWRPPPPQVPEAEYTRLRDWLAEHDVEGEQLVEDWYRLDRNADPAEYRLKRRTGAFEDADAWKGVEDRLAAALAAAAARLDGLTEDARRRYLTSATAQEVARGALEVAEPDRAVAFVRDIEGAADPDRASAGRDAAYVDDDQAPLDQLKGDVRDRLDQVITGPTVAFGDGAPVLDEGYLADFARGVREALAASIRQELEHPRSTAGEEVVTDPLEEEIRVHRRFAEERAAHFRGRDAEVAEITGYLHHDDPQPLVVHGEGGCGKSALLARVLSSAGDGPASDPLVVARFIGATPSSADGRALLISLCEELGRATGDLTPVPSDVNDLVADFARRLESAGAARPVWVVVDSLDQLGGAAAVARSLTWVPRNLPAGVRMVLSTRAGVTLDPLRGRARLLELGGLTREDGEALVKAWLGAAPPRRTLQDHQLAAVVDAFVASRGNPLYLRLATEEARRWESGDGEPPETLAVGVRELIRHNLLERLASEDNHGDVLVRTALGYLAASRGGLAEDELTDLLARDVPLYRHVLLGAYHVPEDLTDCAAEHPDRPEGQSPASWVAELREQTRAGSGAALDELLDSVVPAGPDRPRPGTELPVVLWSRLSFDLGPYLAERSSESGSLLSFYHRELQEVAAEEYVAGDAGLALHSRMADYFRELADPRGDRTWTAGVRPDRRGLSELPHHLTCAHRWDDLAEVLTDFTFLEQKATHVGVVERADGERVHTGVFALEADYDEALEALGPKTGAGERAPLIVTAVDLGQGLVVRCPHCNTVHPFGRACEVCGAVHRLEDWQGQDVTCPAPSCGGPLRINAFVVEGP